MNKDAEVEQEGLNRSETQGGQEDEPRRNTSDPSSRANRIRDTNRE